MDIRWLDGKDSQGQFVLKIDFIDGKQGFLKSPSLKDITEKRDLYTQTNPEINTTTIFDPLWREVA